MTKTLAVFPTALPSALISALTQAELGWRNPGNGVITYQRIDESPSHYFFYVGPAIAVVVPKRGGGADLLVDALRKA